MLHSIADGTAHSSSSDKSAGSNKRQSSGTNRSSPPGLPPLPPPPVSGAEEASAAGLGPPPPLPPARGPSSFNRAGSFGSFGMHFGHHQVLVEIAKNFKLLNCDLTIFCTCSDGSRLRSLAVLRARHVLPPLWRWRRRRCRGRRARAPPPPLPRGVRVLLRQSGAPQAGSRGAQRPPATAGRHLWILLSRGLQVSISCET